ncbi:outer membrane beta-barrel family protein [Aquiflexum lacus]|uniref:outer membrane beta-barrel family protein n=1 Tax=Aquiflexum lacus TaxID=2483805 RepID=UPI001892EA13|nr:outer membrane beta-barrel family protein [Aquiflexum lacus]
MKSVLSYLSILIFILFGTESFAQTHIIKGKVTDATSNQPMEFANIALLSPGDSSLVTGVMSDLDGTFSFESEIGDYILRIGFIGYESAFKYISVGDKNILNVGNIQIKTDATNLQEVVVEGVSSIFTSDIDKRTYNVENSIVAEGATAAELLGTLPSIQVDEEGGISMRGSGEVLIYINGRPSNLSSSDTDNILSQFPANSIKSVELITNPSSRYDAAGVGGIINIILKKNQDIGFNGQVNASIGTRDKYQAGINLNYRTDKVNYYAAFDFQDRRRFRIAEGRRENFVPGISRFLVQEGDEIEKRRGSLFRTGMDYNISEKSVFGVYAQANFGSETEDELTFQNNLNINNELDSIFSRDRFETSDRLNFETGVYYTLNLDSSGQKLFTSFSYAYDNREQSQFTEQTFYNSFNEFVPENSLNQLDGSLRESNFSIFQVDYENPLGENGKIEAGVKGTFGKWMRDQSFSQGTASNEFIPVPIDSLNDIYTFNEDVYASYLIYRNRFNKFGYQVGLRGEYTRTMGQLESSGEEFINNYFNLFPSVYTSYTLGEEQEISANYSRRISRPNIWSLSPIYNLRDQLNFSVGNPTLQPELTDSYEVGYMKGWSKYLLNATVYHRYSTNIQTRIITLLDDNITIQSRENANVRKSTGLELVNQIQVTDWFDLALTGNFFYSEIFGDNLGEGFNNSNFSWTLNLLSTMAIPNLFSVQVQGNYRGPIVFPQGEIEPYWGLNIGVRKDILNKKATISLNVSDVFNTQIFRIKTIDSRFVYNRAFNRETRIGTLGFTYRFGGFRDKNGKREGGREDMEDMDF